MIEPNVSLEPAQNEELIISENSFEAKYYTLLQEHTKILKQFNNLLNKKK